MRMRYNILYNLYIVKYCKKIMSKYADSKYWWTYLFTSPRNFRRQKAIAADNAAED
jgi:hypothetical protein